MSTLIVATYDELNKAEKIRQDLVRNPEKAPVAPEEAVVVEVNENREVRINHTTHFTISRAVGGGFVGFLVGLILVNPVLALVGGIAGTGLGAVIGALKEAGIDERFVEDLATDLKPDSSALFVRTGSDESDRMVAMLEPGSNRILKAALAHRDEMRLKSALREVETPRTG